MEYRYKTLSYSELKELKFGITPENVCSRIFHYFDLPNGLAEEDSDALVSSINDAESVFMAEINDDVENRVAEITGLINGELSQYLSLADDVFLVFVSPKDKKLSDSELETFQNLSEEKFWVCLNYHNAQIQDSTYLYIIAIKVKDGTRDINEAIDAFLDDINDINLGEYDKVLKKKAEERALSIIVDSENHADAVVDVMLHFLEGAEAAIELKNYGFPNIGENFDDFDNAILEEVTIADLGKYGQKLIKQALDFAKSAVYPTNDKSVLAPTVEDFLDGASEALKLIEGEKTEK